jgi:Cyclophilin type peptidyl-prolyl cis-trans isomerase/CLD
MPTVGAKREGGPASFGWQATRRRTTESYSKPEIMKNSSRTAVTTIVVVIATALLAAQGNIEKLKDPSQLTERAPETFRARFDTSQGVFVIAVERAWAPLAADRFYNLVKNGFYNDSRFFRVLDGFMAQFGLHADPEVQSAWRSANLKDEPVTKSNTRGFVTLHARIEPELPLHDDLHQRQGQQLS